ncbi:molybdate ABC transporter substrate-binding protein [Aurantiacibacter sediminis]|uniref:Molybdate ABC transporter substrate-binding protein n=1 Tax=Aurantiacibacter sediminis TaxID=2793064 RepID=A0ABS0MZ13_9SPHN|nr:molybdate ABC transporter substrate-binding protein [Aurantiacibacter sediminis]MBH5320964.1 molybdate ABC transporter substrate-binding protein [Aurantiacibacter sediminis]
MTRSPIIAAMALCCLLALLSACGPSKATGPVVFAPASMQDAMTAIVVRWEAQGNSRPVLNIAGTPALARQLVEGAPADIVITADAQWMDWLEQRDVLQAQTRADLVSNSLVLVASTREAQQLTLDDPDARIALGDPESVPAGRYARTVLVRSGEWAEIAPRIVPTENVRAALALVERGEVEFAFVYGSDLREGKTDAVIISTWPASPDLPITYPIARTAISSHPDAKRFSDFLRSPEAAAILVAYGFSDPVNGPSS